MTERVDGLRDLRVDPTHAIICGPEVMVRPTVARLEGLGLPTESIYVSLERNMQCGIGHCGHCQIGGCLVCRDGPVFRWAEAGPRLAAAP